MEGVFLLVGGIVKKIIITLMMLVIYFLIVSCNADEGNLNFDGKYSGYEAIRLLEYENDSIKRVYKMVNEHKNVG